MKRIARRTYLSLLAGVTVALAGCSGEEADEPEPEPGIESNGAIDEDSGERDSRTAADADSTRDEAESDASAEMEEDADADARHTDVERGALLEMADLHLVVSDFDRVDDLGEESADGLEAEEGSAFAVVDLAVKHAGEEPLVDLEERLSVELTDGDGETFERIDAVEDATLDPTESRLVPGEVARGDVAYVIDAETEGLVLELESVEDGEEYTVDLETEADSSDVLEHELAVDVLSFGQGVERAGIDVTVTTLEHGNNLGGFMQSDEGHEIVAVGLVVENHSGEERTLSPGQIQFKDESGRSYGEAPGVLRALEGIDGAVVKDGEEHDGKVAYQIEEGLSELYVVFDFTEWGTEERVFWKLR